jgi:hypothetical protein
MSQMTIPRTKLVLMNCAVAAALIYKRWTGVPLIVLLVVGLFMFTLVNAVILFMAKRPDLTGKR